ncbi:UPF0179 family protein [Methanofollis aquaemaris]|uniref:UPF0179 protein RJ40_04560 n=1 Tax=Methanofollis aquaemaris TaxID=126734 RepID=A0A8A3S3V6_9EURY|nr:UPF0179 family protein [Methanofollis aquaemaris]QSZ66815.1 UPF0179 family protein [Methanofollis aquaemaris]
MAKPKAKVTLLGTCLAEKGLEFVYESEATACRNCKLWKVCHNLQPGKKYQVVGVRPNTKQECAVHKDGICAVEVIEAPVTTLIPADRAILNSSIHFESPCTRTRCRSYHLCHPDGIIEGEKYIVAKVLGTGPDVCEKGRNLKLVELRPAGA